MSQQFPDQARVVVIGGGIVGCSVAYHLAKMGWSDVLLLEQNELTSGSTWHAAGLVGQLRSSANLTELAAYSINLYAQLEEETDQATGLKQNGAITVARTHERFVELKRQVSMAKCFGVDAEVISVEEVARRYPVARIDDLKGAILIPKDGQINPVDVTYALAKGARMYGARVLQGVRVTKVETRGGGVVGVQTTNGRIACDYVVLCGGMWARELALTAGVAVPLHACEHMYIVTDDIPNLPSTLPVLRDYDGFIYVKEETGKLLIGGFEPVAKPWGMKGLPADRPYMEFGEDWDQFEIMMESALQRLPLMENVGIRKFLNGPEAFTPDTRFMMGEAPEVKNFFVASGFNSIGIASAGGVGRALAEWIIGGTAPMDLWDVDIRRFEPFQTNARYLYDRAIEALGVQYAMHWPYRQPATARNARLLPYHHRLEAAGACFGAVAGWERPMWYAPRGVEPVYEYTHGPQKWWPYVAEEARATREGVALYEMTPFGKYLLEGPDAETVLQRLCTNNIAIPVGRAAYTLMCNQRGGIEAEVTVERLAAERFMVVTSSGTRVHDLHWIRRNIPEGARVHLSDITTSQAVLCLMGPKSRDLLSTLTKTDLSNEAFPYYSFQEIEIGYAVVRAQRTSYVGELGWELYIPIEFAVPVYDLVVAAGEAFGLKHAGMHCMDSCRLEKGYKHWGHDIGPEETPLETGLGFAVDFSREFIGAEALRVQKAEGLRKRSVIFTINEGTPLVLHDEPIYRDGALVGRTTSGNFGFTIGRPISKGLVRNPDGVGADWVRSGRWEIEVAGQLYEATPHLSAPHDPKGTRVRA